MTLNLKNEDHKEILSLICKETELDLDSPFNPVLVNNIYQYGSRVYNTVTPDSDYDIIMVSEYYEGKTELEAERLSCTLYGVSEFVKLIDEHEISALECLWLPESKVLKSKINFPFQLSLPQLRKSISTKSSHSFVKAKKKLTVEKDYNLYVGLKSLFHAFRIVLFGTQIAEHGKIVDYEIAEPYHRTIVSGEILHNNNWEDIKELFKPKYNDLMTEFRKLVPKE